MRATKSFPPALQTLVKNLLPADKKPVTLPLPADNKSVPVTRPLPVSPSTAPPSTATPSTTPPECLRCGRTDHQAFRCTAKYDRGGFEI